MTATPHSKESNPRGRASRFLALLGLVLSAGCSFDLGDALDRAPIVVGERDAGDAGDDVGFDDDLPADDDVPPPPDDDVVPSPVPEPTDDDEPDVQPTPGDDADDDLPPPPDDAGTDAGEPEPQPEEAGAELMLVETDPAHLAVNVDPERSLELEFNREVEAGEGAIILVESLTGGFVEVVDVEVDAEQLTFAANTVTVDWGVTLARSTSYAVLIEPGAIQDTNGVPYEGLRRVGELVFSTAAPEVLSLVDTNPSAGDVDVPLDTDIELVFSAHVSAGLSGSLSLYQRADDALVASALISDTTVVTVLDDTVTVNLPGQLAYSTEYYVTLDVDAVQGMDGAPYAGFSDDSVLHFRTVDPPALLLASSTPMNGAVGVDPATPLVFTFSAPVASGAGFISIFEAQSGALVEAVDIAGPAVSFSSDTVTVGLGATLAEATEYTVTLDEGVVVSELGARFAGLSGDELSFTTADVPPQPLLLVDTRPVTGATGVARDAELVLVFSQSVRAGAGNVTIFRDDGTPFEVVSVTGPQVSITGAEVTIEPSLPFSGTTTYYVLVNAGSFESLEGAVYAGLADENGFRFTTEAGFGLVSVSPLDGTADVDPATNLVLTFSAPPEAGNGSILVYSGASDELLEEVPIDDPRVTFAGNTATVDLDCLLDGAAPYYVLVDAGAIVASDGESFEGVSSPDAWNFTTANVVRPGSVAAGLVLWLDADLAASVKVDSAVRFWADRSGQHNDVSNGTSAQRPSRVANAIGTRSAIRFDGDDDWLHAESGLPLAAAEGFIVWRSTRGPSTSAKRSLLVNGENLEVNHSDTGGFEYSVASCITLPYTGNAWSSVRFSPAPAANVTELWSFGFDATTTSVFSSVQGGSISFQPAPTTVPVTPSSALGIGGDPVGCAADDGCHFDGDIGEVILYSRRLSQSERLAVVAYLRTKWSVPQVSCASGEVLGDNGNCYYLNNSFIPWASARDACAARRPGWALATVRSQLDNDEIVALLTNKVGDAWFGASDDVPNTWRWVTDTLQFWSGASASSGGVASNGAYTNWRSNEPSGGTAEACGRYNLNNGVFSWSDAGCADSYPSVCQGPGQ